MYALFSSSAFQGTRMACSHSSYMCSEAADVVIDGLEVLNRQEFVEDLCHAPVAEAQIAQRAGPTPAFSPYPSQPFLSTFLSKRLYMS